MADINDTAFAPGEYIRDEIEARGWTQEALAHILGRPLRTVNLIISGKAGITPQTAQELAAAFGTSAEMWMNLESAYRLALEKKGQDDVARRAALYERAPVRDMIRRKWIDEFESVEKMEGAVDDFFSTPLAAAARMSTSYDEVTPGLKAWLSRAAALAGSVAANPYSKQKALTLIPDLHALTSDAQEVRRVPAVLAEMGIRFVLLEHLPRTRIDGAAIWLPDDQPAIAISLRYDRIDCFWHTLFHEVSHVLHEERSIDNDLIGPNKLDPDKVSEVEKRADRDACNFLIPPDKLRSFIIRHRPRFSKVNIIRFAGLHGIHPGIVVGQLQHSGAIQYSHSREMLVPVRDLLADAAMTDGWGHYPGI